MISQFRCLDCGKYFVQHVEGYAKCPFCHSLAVTGVVNAQNKEKEEEKMKKDIEAIVDEKLKDYVPKLPLIIDEKLLDSDQTGTMNRNDIVRFVDRHVRLTGALPRYVGITKEIYDEYDHLFLCYVGTVDGIEYTIFVSYRDSGLPVKIVD